MSAKPALLFDLDGTLTDPKSGITNCIRHAIEKMDIPVDPADDLNWCIGPPLYESFGAMMPDAGQADIDRAIVLYRDRFQDIGIYENELCDGIEAAVEGLHRAGYPLLVVTSKPHVYADRIIDHFGLRRYFPRVYGSELDGARAGKRDLLAHIFATEGIEPANAVMIGDRRHDIEGARAHGAKCIGVQWGYGSDEELTEAGADRLVAHPSELAAALNHL